LVCLGQAEQLAKYDLTSLVLRKSETGCWRWLNIDQLI
jgi:hypothetical protein